MGASRFLGILLVLSLLSLARAQEIKRLSGHNARMDEVQSKELGTVSERLKRHVRIAKEAIGVVIPGLTSGSTVRIRLIDMQGRCACMTVQPCGLR